MENTLSDYAKQLEAIIDSVSVTSHEQMTLSAKKTHLINCLRNKMSIEFYIQDGNDLFGLINVDSISQANNAYVLAKDDFFSYVRHINAIHDGNVTESDNFINTLMQNN